MTFQRPPLPALAAFAVIVLTAVSAAAQGRPAGVETAPVTLVEMSDTTRVFGQVVAERESAVAARVPGVAVEVPVRVGSRVEKGDILAQLDMELLQIEARRAESQLAIAEAGVQVAEARLDRARKAFERAQTLRASANISDASLEERQSALAEATGLMQEAMARIAAARNTMDEASYTLRNATIRAPFDGVVLTLSTQVGQYVNAGSEVVSLLDLDQIEVRANVPSQLVDVLETGRDVAAQTATGARLNLSLRAILPTEYANTQTRPVLFAITQAAGPKAVGQSISLDLPTSAPREVLVVPKDALVQARGGWSVFVNDGGTAAPRPVEIGAAVGGAFEVLSGLQLGDEVVVRGNERLRPGQPIAPAGAGAPGGRPGAGEGGGPPGRPAEGPPQAQGGPAAEDTAPRVVADNASEQG
ncbi:efflux RND transporter periplasmic adaptor subunit [Pseudoruegeria sp. SHC-113]|uniref:efflux RND transporter periplasmic adaptor subunit n=1 Tax=Pseudoruegeria sp. SHC-113 TaxID=2855439 RepID=UPI0021BA7902|nr:efflux RND transporter periplasmic adaptor subunit [Pseudoruegeria sp. SHC-113]MCT8162102.1 efflux RND transporter periplasmic adaptor subunit [Pseudoruegeria sp. SHC-113]